jgi:hypothetical protein
VIEVLPTAICAACAANLVLALRARRTGHAAAAHAMNGAALAIAGLGALGALVASGMANVNAPGVLLLVLVLALAGLCCYGALGRPLPGAVFWLAWCANGAVVASLLYLLIAFRIF